MKNIFIINTAMLIIGERKRVIHTLDFMLQDSSWRLAVQQNQIDMTQYAMVRKSLYLQFRPTFKGPRG